MPPHKLQLAIVGLRHLHPRLYMPHLRACDDLQVVAALEKDASIRESFCREFGLKGYADLVSLFSDSKPTIAAIFLPHDECVEAALACAEKGIHVMVEKPVATSSDAVETLAAVVASHQVQFTTGYCWRMHPVAEECRRIIQTGILGTIVSGSGRCVAGRVDRYITGNAEWMLQRKHAGGGPLFNLGVHWIDLFRWLFTDEVVEVSGNNVKINKQYDIEDNSFAQLRFSRGAVVALDISYTVPQSYPHGRDLFISVRGTQGCLSWAPAFEGEKDILEICTDHPDFSGAPMRRIQFDLETVPGYAGIMGRKYILNFLRSVRQGTPPAITVRDAIAALRVVESVYVSAETGRVAPVRPI